MFVLDEADEMLSRGFKEQIYDVFKCMPNDVQVSTLLFALYLFSDSYLNIFLFFINEINFLSGGASFSYNAIGSSGSNKSFHERSHTHLSEKRRINP